MRNSNLLKNTTMRKLIYLLLIPLFFSCQDKPVDLNVMSFNIRMDTPSDSLNSWTHRKEVAAEAIRMNDIDLFGTQEVLAHQLKDLKDRLPQYVSIGVGREDGKEAGEFSAIFYKKDRFDALQSGTFWLSETPEVAGSKGWDGACERVASWAVLKEKNSGKKIFFINTHLDHVGKTARQEGVTLLMERAKEYGKGMPIIITGDFNANPESSVIAHVLESGDFNDSYVLAPDKKGHTGTFHGYGRIPVEKRNRIDYIFVTSPIQIISYEALPDQLNGTYISDHAPIMAKIKF